MIASRIKRAVSKLKSRAVENSQQDVRSSAVSAVSTMTACEAVTFAMTIKVAAIQKIYAERPHFKYSNAFQNNFARFICTEVDSDSEQRFLDLGSHDCYLSYVLAEALPSATFKCIDSVELQPLYLTPQISFEKAEILDWLREHDGKIHFTGAILGGVLSLFLAPQRDYVLAWLQRNVDSIFIREVPRYSDLLEIFNERVCGTPPQYNLFTDLELLQLLSASGWAAVAISRNSDYLVACIKASVRPNNTLAI